MYCFCNVFYKSNYFQIKKNLNLILKIRFLWELLQAEVIILMEGMKKLRHTEVRGLA